MGKKKKAVITVLPDTNVILSAVLFTGKLSRTLELWKKGRIEPVLSRETFQELQEALLYPKFHLTPAEIEMILEEEILPFFSVVEDTAQLRGLCKDPDDDKFLSCAISASAEFLVSGDKDLYKMGKYRSVRILRPSDFLKDLKRDA